VLWRGFWWRAPVGTPLHTPCAGEYHASNEQQQWLGGSMARLVLGAALVTAMTGRIDAQSGFVELFDGTLTGWEIVDTTHDNFSVVDGVLRVEAPEGWLRSARTYRDFELDIEFRFLTDDADSGVFFRVAGDTAFRRGWPDRSYQLQMRNPLGESPFAPLGGLFRHGMPARETTLFDEPLARRVTRPTGEWQRLQIVVVGTEVRARINGTEVLVAGDIGNASGWIGLQGETGALEFRSIRVRER
jgi:3-keto-disaccharide hydrolase